MQYINLGDTVYFWFATNDTSGSGGDGASAAADVRLAGAAASAAPVLSPTPDLLSDAGYPAGCYEVAVAATSGNGFATGNIYAVFCTLAIDAQNPTGFIGSFKIDPVLSNVVQIYDSATAAQYLQQNADSMVRGTVDTTAFTPTQTEFECDDITEATSDHFKDRIVIWLAGALQYQVERITAYSLATGRGHFTITSATEAPANNDEILIV